MVPPSAAVAAASAASADCLSQTQGSCTRRLQMLKATGRKRCDNGLRRFEKTTPLLGNRDTGPRIKKNTSYPYPIDIVHNPINTGCSLKVGTNQTAKPNLLLPSLYFSDCANRELIDSI